MRLLPPPPVVRRAGLAACGIAAVVAMAAAPPPAAWLAAAAALGALAGLALRGPLFLSAAPRAARSATPGAMPTAAERPCWMSCARIKEVEARAAAVLGALSDPILCVGPDLRIGHANPAARGIPELRLGAGVSLIHLSGAEVLAACCERAIEDRRPARAETQFGSSGLWEIRCFPEGDGCVAILSSAAEKQHLRNVLSMNQNLLWRILRALPVGVMTVHAEGAGRLLCNEAAERIFGPAPSASDDSHAAFRGRDAETGRAVDLADWASIQDLLADNATVGRTIEMEREQEESRILSVSIAPMPGGGDGAAANGAVVVVADITARVLSERAAVAAMDRAKSADLAKSRFLSAANHDLRQPVQSLVLLMRLVEASATDPRQALAIAKMGEAIGGINLILGALLEVSRLDAGDVRPAPKGFALAPLLARLRDEYAPCAAARGLTLRILPTRAAVLSDPDQIERMLRKLVENALKYTRSGGVLIGCRRRRDRLAIEVVDTGIGIPADQTDAIFEDYHQIGNQQRDRGKGLGLGLAVVRRTARLLGHTISVRSREGRGSRFIIEVPIAMPLPPIAATGATVLVIDDDPLIRVSVCALLDFEGYATIEAEDAPQALAKLASAGAPDAIIADYRLPEGATGVQAIEAVFAAIGRRVPAMILTGDTDPERITEARASGFDLMHKPVGPDPLMAAVHRMLPATARSAAA